MTLFYDGDLLGEAMARTQTFHSKLVVSELDHDYELTIEDIWKFQDESPYKEITVDPKHFESDLEQNPWNARSVREVMRDFKSGSSRLAHAKRMATADDRPIAISRYPAGIKNSSGGEYFILDGFHRVAKALAEGKKKIKARVFKTRWKKTERR